MAIEINFLNFWISMLDWSVQLNMLIYSGFRFFLALNRIQLNWFIFDLFQCSMMDPIRTRTRLYQLPTPSKASWPSFHDPIFTLINIQSNESIDKKKGSEEKNGGFICLSLFWGVDKETGWACLLPCLPLFILWPFKFVCLSVCLSVFLLQVELVN